MSSPLGAGIPVTTENAQDWPDIASDIEKRSGTPPTADLSVVERFMGDCIALLSEADRAHNPELLRGSFADELVGRLLRLTVPACGWTAVAAHLVLIGAPAGVERAVLRIRANVQARDQDGDEPSVHEQFWDLAFGDLTATVATTNCPNCGAPLTQGVLVCPYCHTDTRATAHVPLQVVRLQRLT
jgi:hypothetical protein